MAIIILYESDHQARAQALGQTIGAQAYQVDTRAKAVMNLDTILFWGHGDQFQLCGKNAQAIKQIVKNWKAVNSKLKTVEILTCNARHATGTASPIANQIKQALHGFMSSTSAITVKALPVTVSGKHNAWSILLADTGTRSWVYVTAPGTTDTLMMQAQALIRFDQGVNGMVSYKGDIAVKANRIVADPTHAARTWTMNYGYFNTLRAALVKV